MYDRTQKNKEVQYYLICVIDFAKQYNMDIKAAYEYLVQYGGLDFLEKYYEAEHTLGIEAAIDDLTFMCKKNGGNIE
jgi:hypothetical protein